MSIENFVALIVAIMFLLTVADFLFIFTRELAIFTSLRSKGKIAHVTVIKKDAPTLGPGLCFVEYKLNNISEELTVRQRVNPNTFSHVKIGDTLSVSYLEFNPKIARITDFHRDMAYLRVYSAWAIVFAIAFPPIVIIYILLYLLNVLIIRIFL